MSDRDAAIERSPDGHLLSCGAAHYYNVPCTCDAHEGAAVVDRLRADLRRLEEERDRPREALPAWRLLDLMADAITDERWKAEQDNCWATAEEVAEAKEGDFHATRDDMVTALSALEKAGFIAVDWDAEPPEPVIVQARAVLSPDTKESP